MSRHPLQARAASPPSGPASGQLGDPVAWWSRDFPGGADQVPEARHWIGDLLPECDPLADLLLLASELCANAVIHTRSGQAGGWFSVTVEWTSALARVVVGDQGSLLMPTTAANSGNAGWAEESGRGLWLVDELADDWGTASRPEGRWLWADIRWQAKGGPALQVPGGMDAALPDITLIRRAFPGTTIWWGHQAQAWQAALPGTNGLLSSATRGGLSRELADVYPEFRHVARAPCEPCFPPIGKPLRKGTAMTTARCTCGFTELADETMTDHLLAAFEPDDCMGTDGLVHEEGEPLACACGFAASTPDDLDEHFLKSFTPAGAIGRDGHRHEAVDGA
jgi:serine/threonine-protein kinase RsbW